MQLTKHTDYALRSLMYLGELPPDKLSTITELAEQFSIPKNHLMKVISEMAALGYIETVRGSRGGIKLSREALMLHLGDLIRQFEANMDLINCDEPVCPVRGNCALKRALREAQEAFVRSLNQYTLTDLIANTKGLAELIAVEHRA